MRIRWYVPAFIIGVSLLGALLFAGGQPASKDDIQHSDKAAVTDEPAPALASEGRPRVKVISPTAGGLERSTTQPGSVHAFKYAELFAKVSGYLKNQYVD